jgi:hypothetical protein
MPTSWTATEAITIRQKAGGMGVPQTEGFKSFFSDVLVLVKGIRGTDRGLTN